MKRVISNNLYMLRFVLTNCPMYLVLSVVLAILNSLSLSVNVYILKVVVDSLGNLERLKTCFFFIAIKVIFDVGSLIIRTVMGTFLFPKYEQLIKMKLQLEIMHKALSINFSSFDDQSFYNDYNMAIAQSDTRVLAILNTISSFVSAFLCVGSMTIIVSTLKPSLIFLAIIGAASAVIIQSRVMQLRHKYVVEAVPIQRKMAYTQRIIYLKEFVQEVRINPSFVKVIKQEYSNVVEEMFSLILIYAKKLFGSQLLSNSITNLVSASAMAYLALQVFLRSLSVGEFVALQNATMQIFGQLRALIEGLFQLYDHSLYIENFRKFMSIPDRLQGNCNVPLSEKRVITIKNLNYSYAGCSHSIIQDINIEIETGEKIAIVGSNGSGKTTFTKLLLGLYQPSSGEIALNGINISNFNYDEYLGLFGVALQDFQLFAVSIAENILLRPMQDKQKDEMRVWEALEYVELDKKVAQLPLNIYTPITKEFDDNGIVFSGGELQRLAIARAFIKDTPYLVLDEPTNALDPIAEAQIMELLFKLGDDKILIFVSHRLESVKRADRIIVMENGKIREDGKYTDLITKNGLFAKMVRELQKAQLRI